ncbi:Cytotoxic translational repressor of toxin-antitoxin stability system [Geoglobus ahangari]|uniref:Cytotoxic translational repressor of toxin-antitoxin stability system n=1 Tax=Geoglobus ahangari TaxID=113653 RepID=A0A0F7IDR2_9EURY|nr:hypothetical protein [Geoglobus ahangari]AKG91614.1 Cytotoxic translational repressor of toxin-antitoxin stability system [Geoglobus ahangari]
MSFKVELSERAVKDLKKFSRKDLERVFKTIEKLNDPFSLDIKKIKDNIYRVRAGRKIRLIVEIDFKEMTVLVARIDWRDRVYDRL